MWSNQNEGLHKEKRNGRAGYLMNSSQHGVGEDDDGDEADRPPPQDRPTRPLQNMDYYTFAWNQKGPNNVFRVGWYVCGRTKMKDYIRRNETDVPAI